VLDRDEVLVCCDRPERLAGSEQHQAALALLTPDERDRVARFHFERDRDLQLTARALLRRTLSRCADVDPAHWRFVVTPGGRPEIAAPTSSLRFSVTHTPGLAMVAVVVERDVGVDAERVPPSVPFDVAGRTFTADERAALEAVAPGAKTGRFAEIWTLKEAYVKARGLGLALPLEAIGFALDPPRIVAGDDPLAWHLESFSPTPAHRAAICLRRADRAVVPRILLVDEACGSSR